MREQPSAEYERLRSEIEELRSELRRMEVNGPRRDPRARAARRRRWRYVGIGVAMALGLLGARTTLSDGGSVVEALFVSPKGLVGIGTTTPREQLDVHGKALFSSAVVEGQSEVQGKSTLAEAEVRKSVTVGGALAVNGGATLNGGVTITGGVTGLSVQVEGCSEFKSNEGRSGEAIYFDRTTSIACPSNQVLVNWRVENTTLQPAEPGNRRERGVSFYRRWFTCCRLVVK